ncbi:hypothetical protein RUND412_001704 [Rhizina undulata]
MVACSFKPDGPSDPMTADFNTSGHIFIAEDNLALLLYHLQAQLNECNVVLKNYNCAVQLADKITGALAIGLLTEMSDVSNAEPDDEFWKLQEKLIAEVMKDSTNESDDKKEKSEVIDVIEQLRLHTASKARKLKQIQNELYVAPQPVANSSSGDMGLNEDTHAHNQKIKTNLPAHMGNTGNIAEYECDKSILRYDENPWGQLQDPVFQDIERHKKRWAAFQARPLEILLLPNPPPIPIPPGSPQRTIAVSSDKSFSVASPPAISHTLSSPHISVAENWNASESMPTKTALQTPNVFAELDPYGRLDFGLRASNSSRVLACKKVSSHILKAGKKEFESLEGAIGILSWANI